MNYRIYPSIGIARLGNGLAQKDDVVFSPEVPWANLYETGNEYRSENGAVKKQAQRFYIYACDDNGNPTGPINENDFTIEWTAEVANKKPFWYDFNNSLDLSAMASNQNLSPNLVAGKIAPGISASYRNPNVLNQGLRSSGAPNYRKELVNNPGAVTVSSALTRQEINGKFPNADGLGAKGSAVASALSTPVVPVKLGTLEYDAGTLIFYGGDGISAALNPSDLNTDFADNSNWYDDICDGRITAKITNKSTGDVFELNTADTAAWVATAPPDYAPQIQPIATMYDLICGASNPDYGTPDFSLIFPVFYRFYRMQWVNMGDFLAPSFKETIDEITAAGDFAKLFDPSANGKAVRTRVFEMFRNPEYNPANEPIIPAKDKTDLMNLGSGNEELKLPFYPGDGINYPGSPAQWFAIPPMLYNQLKAWAAGNFTAPAQNFSSMDDAGKYYQAQFHQAAQNSGNTALLMTRAVLETLYGGGFHPGVELTWPMRHSQMYSQNTQTVAEVTPGNALYGLREIRVNAATAAEQEAIFYNDFGLEINADDVIKSLDANNADYNWLWKSTPGDLTKWMGIPWQSDAGSCQAVFTDSQYPVPAWWAANLPVDVLTEASLVKMRDTSVTEDTRINIYANRLPWLKTTDTGYVGYHAEGGYMNGLINMVYQWKDIGMVTGRATGTTLKGVPEIVYVSLDSKNRRDKMGVFLGKAFASVPAPPNPPSVFYTNVRENVYLPEGKQIILSSQPGGTGDFFVDDVVTILVNGTQVYTQDFSNGCSGIVSPLQPTEITSSLSAYLGQFVDIEIQYSDKCGGYISSSAFYLTFK